MTSSYTLAGTPDAAKTLRDFGTLILHAPTRADGTHFYRAHEPLTSWPEGVFAEVLREDGPPFDLLWAGLDPLISDRLRAAIEREAPGEVQFLPVALRFPGGDRGG